MNDLYHPLKDPYFLFVLMLAQVNIIPAVLYNGLWGPYAFATYVIALSFAPWLVFIYWRKGKPWSLLLGLPLSFIPLAAMYVLAFIFNISFNPLLDEGLDPKFRSAERIEMMCGKEPPFPLEGSTDTPRNSGSEIVRPLTHVEWEECSALERAHNEVKD